ncbi:histidine phosphatase family protein [Solibacillus isronensis]|uniref:histidine phosphatase family protein n=1 Tax=Solibacillus isronensis TaxID=412383 RepID=UPI0009A6ECAA|nr:histidine phosphatase family protein [Solibacillus isronensis]
MANDITVHLIRHEKTKANVERKYIGWTDEPILKKVEAEINLKPSIVYGSDLRRCRETAQCYFPNAEFIASRELRELHFGDFEMCTYEQLQHSETYRAWIADPLGNPIPNGETFTRFKQRVLDGFHRIANEKKEYTFIVHGGVIRLLLAIYGKKEQTFQQTVANHRTIYTLGWDSVDELIGGARCTLYSEAHITVNENMQKN